ncbi:hypothetical protein CIK05_14650 [Bdellovibrio sp. qaytius]|nr:hypothetical protein CIK05_14650 [Bdellovibrio sp. qaytius]
MNDDSHSSNVPKSSLKSEWTLLLEAFEEEDIPKIKELKAMPREFLNEAVQQTMRELSDQKHTLFQQIEAVKSQIEETHVVIENLELVGSATDDAHERIADLHDQGKSLTETIDVLDEKIKKVRSLAG